MILIILAMCKSLPKLLMCSSRSINVQSKWRPMKLALISPLENTLTLLCTSIAYDLWLINTLNVVSKVYLSSETLNTDNAIFQLSPHPVEHLTYICFEKHLLHESVSGWVSSLIRSHEMRLWCGLRKATGFHRGQFFEDGKGFLHKPRVVHF